MGSSANAAPHFSNASIVEKEAEFGRHALSAPKTFDNEGVYIWCDPDGIWTVVGSRMMAVFDDTRSSEKIWLYDKGVDTRLDYTTYGEYLSLRTGDILIPRVDSTEPPQAECSHFIECVNKRSRPRSDGIDGLKVLNVLTAAQKSMEHGGAPIEIKPVTIN